MSSELEAAVEHVRPALLRHCYRMLGSWADAEDVLQDALERAWKSKESFRGDAPISRWLFTIATNACLTALKQRQRRSLPQLDLEPVRGDAAIGAMEADRFVTPAPDALLFPDPEALSTSRETVTLAFIALLQRVPPRQRAVLLLKDVLGWSAAEIAEAFDMSVAAVNSALHRSHAAVARPVPPSEAPSPTTLQRFVTAWRRATSTPSWRSCITTSSWPCRRTRCGSAASTTSCASSGPRASRRSGRRACT